MDVMDLLLVISVNLSCQISLDPELIFVAFCFSLNKNVDSECSQKTVSL